MTDPIADMLTRIRNGLTAGHKTVDVPTSGIKIEIAKILKDEGYIHGYSDIAEAKFKTMRIELKYKDDGCPVIDVIKRESKPGRRVYIDRYSIPRVMGGMGVAILSTSRGVMTGVKARGMGIGGELLATIS